MRQSTPPDRALLTRSAAIASITVALILVALKAWASWRTGSTAMLGSLADSTLDLLASGITLFAVWFASKPADHNHRFGHGKAEALAALPGPLPRPANPESADAPAPRDRAGPDTGPPPYRLPVAGRLLVGLGEVSDAGVRSRGLSIESAPGAQIVAPTDGRIVFAGPFRRYGTIIILDHGKGWSSAITGIGRLQVSVGDTVRQGAPIGTAERGDAPVTTVELRRRGVPVDLTGLLG